MTLTKIQYTLVAACIGIFGLAAGYWFGAHRHATQPVAPTERTHSNPQSQSPNNERKVLYWFDPMSPQQHFDKPGKSPLMDMQLVAKYADDDAGGAGIKIDSGVLQNLGIRLIKVERSAMPSVLEAVGAVQWNERQVAIVQTRSAGFVERVYAHAPGDVIAKGAPLADMLVPEWASAQTEFLALVNTGDANLVRAARERIKLLGMPPDLIARVEASRKVQATVSIVSPIAGVIQSLDVRLGMTLAAGMTLAKINGIDPIWVEGAIPESQAAKLTVGDSVALALTAFPGKSLQGKIITILPETNEDSRTLRVRIELPNRDASLKPGMFARIKLSRNSEEAALHLPSEAIIRSGTRNIVLLSLPGNHFLPAEVKLGREANGNVEILDGLQEGQEVVASGQFLIDSEANLKGVLAKMSASSSGATP